MKWYLTLGFCGPAFAHVISMSTGQATVAGNRVGYILRMPDYEIGATKNPADALFSHIRFSIGFETGRLIDRECHHDTANSAWLCGADYQFSRQVEQLHVECSFHEITVANHIHVLRAERDGKTDRAILDSSFPSATLAFRPPTALERGIEQTLAGVIGIWTNRAGLLLLFALAVASRTRIRLAVAGGAFLAAQCAVTIAMPHASWQPAPRLAEAGAALSLAYLALETIVFPAAGGRWLLALIFGAFSGLYFSALLTDSGYAATFVLAGAAGASVCVLAISGIAAHFLMRWRLERWAAGALLAAGGVWFAIRLVR